ncbi:hypothetical protein B5F74_10960 [Collinsella sp. An271]|nr:hypothetical protein B5F74_10960 [Collinsella sp. An271]
MRGLALIPRKLLPNNRLVCADSPNAECSELKMIRHVLFEREQRESPKMHRGVDAGCGAVFIDAVNS